ncbi:hypothetical protein BV898_14514 [Hypsibius exemplaris]|uniref:SEA domain-containing protein n=1 Tax=Hypsibius exemplaris TaxID=2072580 RepID=A0A9X6N8W2_HYPEX|nr:hypothetical protein BV898_14514 [Hypsibius exemplaris]
MGFSSLILVGCQVVLACHLVQGADFGVSVGGSASISSSGSYSFSSSSTVSGHAQATDVSELTYTTTAERDALLQKILGLWNAAVGSGSLTITFVSEKASLSGNHLVTYTVSGEINAALTITWQQLLDKVHAAIDSANIPGLKNPSGGVTVEHWSKQVVGGSIARFTIKDILDLSYSGSVERDALLQKILTLWIEVLGSLATGLQVSFVSGPASDHGSYEVTYTITGTAPGGESSINIDTLKVTFHKLIESGRIGGVKLVIRTISGGGEISKKVVTSSTLTLKDELDFVYTTTVERDFLLQLVVNLWTQTLGGANIGKLSILIISESESCKGGHNIKYSITGKVGKIGKEILAKIHELIGAGKIANVFPKGKRCNEGEIEISTDTEIETITGTVELTYTTEIERDALLQLILKLWVDAYGCTGPNGLKINFISASPTGKGTFLVTYTITGTACATEISWEKLLIIVNGYLEKGKVPGAKPPPNKVIVEPPPEVTDVPVVYTNPPPTRPRRRNYTVFDKRR